MQAAFGLKCSKRPKQWVWFQVNVKSRSCQPRGHGMLQIKIWREGVAAL